jgi:hypothetical protein
MLSGRRAVITDAGGSVGYESPLVLGRMGVGFCHALNGKRADVSCQQMTDALTRWRHTPMSMP